MAVPPAVSAEILGLVSVVIAWLFTIGLARLGLTSRTIPFSAKIRGNNSRRCFASTG